MSERTITPETHRLTAESVGAIVTLVRMLPLEQLEAIVSHGRRYDTVGPILDPTGWARDHKRNEQDTRIFAGVLTLRRTLDDVAAEIGDTDDR